jgi:AcrR family transcriptional regulator
MNSPRSAEPTRGHDTRQALVRAALEIFGRDGYDAASTRAIAEAAGANQALIGYHFKGKDGLYLAVFDHIAERLGGRLHPVAAAIEVQLETTSAPPPPGTARIDRYLPPLLELVDAFTAALAADEAAGWARLIIREQQSPTPAFEILYERMIAPLADLTGRLIAAILDVEPRSKRVELLVFTTLGQALTFRAARASVLRRTGWSGVGPEELAQIQARIRGNVAAMLRAEMEANA